MIVRKELKEDAKSKISGLVIITCFCYAVMVQLTSVEFWGLTSSTESMGVSLNIIGFIIYGPLELGLSIFILNILKDKSDTKFSNLFSGFKSFGKAFLLSLVIGISVMVGMILFVIPGVVVALMFSQAFYILAEEPEISVKDCLIKSMNIMKGYKCKFILITLSFLGWFILSILTFGLGLLLLFPYYSLTMGNFYLNIKNNYEN